MITVESELEARGDHARVFVRSMSPPGPRDHVVLIITNPEGDHVAHVLADDLIRAVQNAVNTGRVE